MDHDVVVVGAGPAGVTLANLLGGWGISVAVVDREPDVVEEPRAVGIDDEALRTLQTFEMAEPVLRDAVRNAPIRYYDSRGRVLAHVAPSQRPFGWPRRNLFFQPNLERVLRGSLDRFPSVNLSTSTEAVALEQTPDGVELKVQGGEGERTLTARYLAGADGGRSFVRDALGIQLEGDTAPMKWLVVDVESDTWDAPYSAVYTSSVRPSMTIPLPFGYRRFEFQVLDDEDPDEMLRPERVATLLAPFYPGSSVPPPARRRIYWHHSRTASSFQRGRSFLVGDAAHLQPPFFGQGMNSGLRDVTNLAWKLAFVLLGRSDPALLDTYDLERRGTAEAMVKFATGVGRLYKPRNRGTEVVRNAIFRGVQRVPGARDYILQMRYKPVPRYTSGFVLTPPGGGSSRSLVGRAFPQPPVQRLDGERVLLDDVMGHRLTLLSLVPGIGARLDAELLGRWHDIDGVVLESHVTPSYRREGQLGPSGGSDGVEAFYDIDGALRDLLLSSPADQVYVVRPDRYVAASGPMDDVGRMATGVLDILEDRQR